MVWTCLELHPKSAAKNALVAKLPLPLSSALKATRNNFSLGERFLERRICFETKTHLRLKGGVLMQTS
jgi:hypothetical protein